ncbi:unnamed protein product [Protopolystoma xenopodis]|uniref:Uncharacterized protein n=1 Tax=Protopolystoma xenopodis TaxID=117903 RepID=A0A3S5FFZ0_9PLAT|nr:unnamed protein product [Protopolystoma xenopodis]
MPVNSRRAHSSPTLDWTIQNAADQAALSSRLELNSSTLVQFGLLHGASDSLSNRNDAMSLFSFKRLTTRQVLHQQTSPTSGYVDLARSSVYSSDSDWCRTEDELNQSLGMSVLFRRLALVVEWRRENMSK